jgi:secreted trypsin-like serine protease
LDLASQLDLSTGYDIALVQLSSAVTGIAPAVRYTGANELGALATSVGFGKTGTGVTGAITFDGKKRAGQNVVDRFYSSQNNRILLSDFDNPANAADNAFGSSVAGNLEYLIAPGDSGGGLFLDFGQGPLLAGVHSFGSAVDGLVDSDYGDRSGHTRVSVFNSWIDSILGIGGGSSGNGGNNRGGKKKFTAALGAESAAVPEPGSLLMMLVGVASMKLANRRRRLGRRSLS